MDGWMDEWMDGCMDGWEVYREHFFHIWVPVPDLTMVVSL
jgi:hypothetical protein